MAGKITGAPKGAKKAGNGGNGRPLSADDNLTPEEKAKRAAEERRQREEAEGIQLLSVVGRVRAQSKKVEAARAALKAEQEGLNEIFRAAKAACSTFERGRIMELIKDSAPGERRNVAQNEEIRARFRRLMGLPVGGKTQEELDLEGRLPDVERDGAHWQAIGYTTGISGADRDPPLECVKAGHGNRYDTGYDDGRKSYMQALEANAPKPLAAPKPEETEVERRAREKKEEAQAKAGLNSLKADAGGDNVVQLADAKKTPAEIAAEVGAQAATDFAADQAAEGETV